MTRPPLGPQGQRPGWDPQRGWTQQQAPGWGPPSQLTGQGTGPAQGGPWPPQYGPQQTGAPVWSAGPLPKKPLLQRPGLWAAIAAVVLGAFGSAAQNDDPAPASAASATTYAAAAPTTQEPVPTTPAPVAVVPTPAPAPVAAPVVDFAMPSVIGLDLQAAQDTVQTYGVFRTVSHDLLGNRSQVLDCNWIVCDQNVPPGQQVTGEVEGTIDFGVVKRGEGCP